MISFKQFLTESRSAPLYHATTCSRAEKICKDDLLKVGAFASEHMKHAVSLTRNFRFARGWIDEFSTKGVIFQLNQQKLTTRYKIKPFNYFSTKSYNYRNPARVLPSNKDKNYSFESQYEEAVLSDIKDLHLYVDKIFLTYSASGGDSMNTQDYAAVHHIPVEIIK